MDIFFLVVPIILAFLSRSRGMQHPWGTTVNRIVSWAIPISIICTAIAYVCELPLWLGIFSGIFAYIGAIQGHASEQADTMIDHIDMGFITMYMLSLILMPFIVYLHFVQQNYELELFILSFIPFGFLGSISYWLGYKVHRILTLFGITWCQPVELGVPTTEWSEFLTGPLAFGIAFAAIGIGGKYYIFSGI